MAGYVFRDELAAEKDRQHEATMAGAQGLNPTATTTQAPQQAKPPTQPAFQPQAAPTGGGKAPNPFEAFGKALEAQDPFRQQVQQNVQTQLANPYQGADAANAAARDRLAREANAAQEETRSAAVTAYGGYGTGQAGQAIDKFRSQRLMNQQAFELDAAANRAAQGEAVRSNAVGQGTNLLAQGQQNAATLAGLADTAQARELQVSEAEKARQFQGSQNDLDRTIAQGQFAQQMGLSNAQLAETIRQFNSKEAFDRWALGQNINQQVADRLWQSSENDKARASQEKIVDKQLSQSAAQFADEQSFKRWATQGGWDQAAIDRAWQSDEATKERTSREAIANSQIGSQERMQAVENTFQAAEADKNRTLESMLQGQRIQAQFQLAQLDQTFQERMQQTGYLQTKDLQVLRQDFEKSLQDSGIAAETARQLADQQFRSLEAQRDREFNAGQQQIQNAWQTGERIGSQEFETSIKNLEFEQEKLIQARDAANQRGMQTKQINAEIEKVRMQIASQELMSSAQLMQNDAQFREEIMLKRDISQSEIDMARERLDAELRIMDIDEDRLNFALQTDKVKNAMDIATWGMELGNGSPEAMEPFVKQLGKALETAFKEQGVDMRSEDIAKALMPTVTTTPGGVGQTANGTKGDIENAQATLDDELSGLGNKVNTDKVRDLIDAIGSEDASRMAPGGTFASQDLPPSIKKAFATNGTFINLGNGVYAIDGKGPNKQLATDTIGLYQIIQSGVPKETAQKILVQAIGQARYDAAAKVMG